MLFCCCCFCIILSGGGYYYITNSSSKITSAQSPNTSGQSPSTSDQSPSTSDQSPSTSDQSQITTIKPTTTIKLTTTTPIPVIKWVICGKDLKDLPTIAYSYDGKLWTQAKSIISKTGAFKSVAYNGKMWIAVGPTDFKIASSTDGINWTLNNYESSNGYGSSICWSGSLWVIVGTTNYYGSILTSKNGLDWSKIENSDWVTGFNSVIYNPSINTWVATGGNRLVYSKDGITWTNTSVSLITDGSGIEKITIINSQFVAANKSDYANVIYSTDGITWIRYNNTIPFMNPYRISLFNNTMIAGGYGQFQLAYSSDQGKTWIGSIKSFNADYSNNLIIDIATNNSDIVLAVGYDRNRAEAKMVGQVLTSTDGIKWSLPNLITFMTLINGIASNIPL